MTHILSLETSTFICSAALHKNGEPVASKRVEVEKSHASLLPNIANEVCQQVGLSLMQLDAVAVSEGPGSYTGLRIGVASAKGICYATDIPIISVATLDVLTEGAKRERYNERLLYSPMLDARRMEVYMQLTQSDGEIRMPLSAQILTEDLFSDIEENVIVFGDGMPKFKEIATATNLTFIEGIIPDAVNMGEIAFRKFTQNKFEELAYFEPNYLKEWQTTTPKKSKIG